MQCHNIHNIVGVEISQKEADLTSHPTGCIQSHPRSPVSPMRDGARRDGPKEAHRRAHETLVFRQMDE